jgi:DNA-binding transcriptional ArsR family regulator
MLGHLFGTSIIEKILFSILVNNKCYASQLQRTFDKPLYSFQRALDRLEEGGILVSYREGKTLLYQFNPRYPFLLELTALLKKAYGFLPSEIKEKYYTPIVRRRPRRRGKPL